MLKIEDTVCMLFKVRQLGDYTLVKPTCCKEELKNITRIGLNLQNTKVLGNLWRQNTSRSVPMQDGLKPDLRNQKEASQIGLPRIKFNKPTPRRATFSLYKRKRIRFLLVEDLEMHTARRGRQPKVEKKVGKILMGWNLTAKSVKIWVETIYCGLKMGEFSACWTY